jgi:outer membrane protein TolC
MMNRLRILFVFLAVGTLLAGGCSSAHYRKSADREVYKIVAEKQQGALGHTNQFSIETPYSTRDPREIKSGEIVEDRLESGQRKLTLDEALKLAIDNSRKFQFQKESLYLAALTLSRDRYEFHPHFLAGSTASTSRDSSKEQTGKVTSHVGVDQLLRTGAQLSLSIVNDVLRYYTGDPRPMATTQMTASLVQPLLRGAGAEIVAENLTQSERNVLYEVRTFSRFQNTFAIDIVTTFYRLLQQKDTVRNEYNNYRNLVMARERAEALSRDRLPAFQVDQAHQDELSAKSRYILAAQNYRTRLDQFKTSLGLSLGIELALDDSALDDLHRLGLTVIALDEKDGYRTAVEHRLDLLNEIDRFEDSKRKLKVFANRLKPDLNIFANVSLNTDRPDDYTHFNPDLYRANAGVTLNLPLDRLRERNDYRASLITFERQIRTLATALDDLRNNVRQDLRNLEQAQQSYQIQSNAVALATRRVESATLLLQAGRAQIRDLLEAQAAQLGARNAVTATVVDYHAARLALLVDIGMLDTGVDRFWLKNDQLKRGPAERPGDEEVVPPNQLFGQ